MGILKYFISIFCCMSFLYAQDSKQPYLKSINITKSKKYNVINFTDIHIYSKQTQKKPQDEVKQKQDKKIFNKQRNKDYESQLHYLNILRYEVMSLKSQLGDKEQISVPYGSYIDKKESAQRFNALMQGYNDALKKSGFFVGANFGVLDIYTSGYRNNNFIMTCITPIVVGGNGGYQRFFNHYFGTRLYGGFFASSLNDIYTYDVKNGASQVVKNPYSGVGNLQSLYGLAFMSADILFEFPLDYTFKNYIGGFMGLNIGIMYYRPYELRSNYNFPFFKIHPASFLWNYNLQVDYSFNLGMSLTFDNINRIELGLGIPFSYLELPGFAESENPLETTATNFWRSAVILFNYRLLLKF